MTRRARLWRVVGLAALLCLLTALGAPGVALADGPAKAPYSLGLLPSPPGDYPRLSPGVLATEEPLPEWVDLSAGLPPVGSQGPQASCVGWAVAYYYRSYQEGVEHNQRPQRAEEIFSPAFVYNLRSTRNCEQDAGMTFVEGLRIVTRYGVATLRTMPYDPYDSCTRPSEQALAEAARYRARGYVNLFSGQGTANLTVLKRHLASGDPFLLAVPVYSEFFRVTPQNAVIDLPEVGSTFYGGHAVTVVGYDDRTQTFKFVNSWGAGWGEAGFGYLTYRFVQQKAWEAWIIIDEKDLPPVPPREAYELGGTQSGVPQNKIRHPIFTWEKTSPTVWYRVYWGPDPQGVEEIASVEDPFFDPGPVEGPGTFYLRVQACDALGNTSEWSTLFEFCYAKPQLGEVNGRLRLLPIRPRERLPGIPFPRARIRAIEAVP